jgi:hypothetical protein
MPSIEARNEVVRLTAVVLDRSSLLMHSALHLKRAGLLGYSKGLFYQIGCNRKSVSLGDRLLEFTRNFTIDRIVQYLTQKR